MPLFQSKSLTKTYSMVECLYMTEQSQSGQPRLDKLKGLSTGKKVGLGLGAVTVLAGGFQAIPVVRHATAEFLSHIKGDNLTVDNAQFVSEGSLGPQQPNESVSWWQEMSKKQIQSLAKIPSINILGDERKSTVSPFLQQKAKDAGYTIIYHGDPNDTTGRTVITKGRQISNKDWTVEDMGFGKAGGTVRGVLKAWIPDPEDPTQKDHIYALVADPVSKKEALVRLELRPFVYPALGGPFVGPANRPIPSTLYIIDDLHDGPFQRPSDSPPKQSKKLTDVPTLNDMLRKKSLRLTDLAMPGDYVKMQMQLYQIHQTNEPYRYITDSNGISRAMTFEIRRFGGEKQWESELSP